MFDFRDFWEKFSQCCFILVCEQSTGFCYQDVEDGYEGSVRDLFNDSIVEDGVPDNAAASGVSNSVSVGFSTPVKRRARIAAPNISNISKEISNKVTKGPH